MQKNDTRKSRPEPQSALLVVLLLFTTASCIGITWGLPSRKIDKYLFGGGEVWSGEKIYRLAKAGEKLSPERASRTGADVDVDPIGKNRESLHLPRPSPLEGEGAEPSPQLSPLEGAGNAPIPLTATEEDIAKIYLRYRLYTYQPDEMITMMALAGMRPSRLELDPRLYQYGGLFIYPVGALIKLCGLLGLIDVRSNVIYYLDHPDEFGKFYIVARAYSAAWGLLGVILVYAIASRIARSTLRPPNAGESDGASWTHPTAPPLADARGSDRSHRAGLNAALLFTLMPVVVCMSHEGKPHLPGAVLMLAAVYFAMRSVRSRTEDSGRKTAPHSEPQAPARGGPSNNLPPPVACAADSVRARNFSFLCICCGAAVGMVLSSWPICVLIPLVAWLHTDPPESPLRKGGGKSRYAAARAAKGLLLAVGVYFITNPYVLINAFFNRDVLRSNFGNSLAMYQITRIGEGFVRVLELTIEGATLPILVFGLVALVAALAQKRRRTDPTVWVLVVPAAVFFLQFVAIGAGKPAEYGRFGIFPNAALAIGAACLFNARFLRVHWFLRWVFPAFAVAWVAAFGGRYLRNFHADTTDHASRILLADQMAARSAKATGADAEPVVMVFAEPAPYCCPPLNFAEHELIMVRSAEQIMRAYPQQKWIAFHSIDSGMPRVTDVAALLLCEIGVWEGVNRATPISWANKPFEVRISDERSNRPKINPRR